MEIFDSDHAAQIDNLVGPGTSRDLAMGTLESAQRFTDDLGLWSPPIQSADATILPGKGTNDARVRQMAENDGFVQSGVNVQKDNIVGSDFFPVMKPELAVLGSGADEQWADEFKEEFESKFYLIAESPNNWLDASRKNTLTGLVRMAVGLDCVGGEVLATAEWLRDAGRPVHTAIQMVDCDRLSTPYELQGTDKRIRGGIEMDRYGAAQAYHIRMAHPSDFDRALDQFQWKRIPARKPWGRQQVIYLNDATRPDQTRGVSDIVAGLKALKITNRFRDVTLQNAVANAMFAASIESELPPEAAYAQIGTQGPGKAVTDFAAQYLGAIAAYAKSSKHLQLDGVKIPHLFPGTKLQLRPAGAGGGVGVEFEQSLLRHLAAILGISYEQLSKDYSKTNYSSARAGMVEARKAMTVRKRRVADRFASHILRLTFEEMVNNNMLETMKYSRLPNIYDPLMMDAYTQCDWIGAAMGQVDELKETQAAALRLKYNLSTLEDEIAKQGKDWRKVLIQREKEVKELEARGLVMELDDNMMNAASGEPREKTGEQENASTE